jgi:hypothetical protein
MMFINRCFELRQRGLGRRQLTLGIKLSNAGVTQALILLGLGAGLHGLDDALCHLVLSLVEDRCGLRESALGLGDDLPGGGDSGVYISQFLGRLVTLGDSRGQFTSWRRTIGLCGFA